MYTLIKLFVYYRSSKPLHSLLHVINLIELVQHILIHILRKIHLFIFFRVYLTKIGNLSVPSFEQLWNLGVCLINGRHKPFRSVRRVWPGAAFYYCGIKEPLQRKRLTNDWFLSLPRYISPSISRRTSEDRNPRNSVTNNSILNENCRFMSRYIKCYRFDQMYSQLWKSCTYKNYTARIILLQIVLIFINFLIINMLLTNLDL